MSKNWNNVNDDLGTIQQKSGHTIIYNEKEDNLFKIHQEWEKIIKEYSDKISAFQQEILNGKYKQETK